MVLSCFVVSKWKQKQKTFPPKYSEKEKKTFPPNISGATYTGVPMF
jgi:hypothetical protein